VEFALVLPIMLVLLLATAEVGLLADRQLSSRNAIGVLADLAALDPSNAWEKAVSDENAHSRCNAAPLQPDVAYPDSGKKSGGSRIRLTWHCHFETVMPDIWPNGIDFSVSADAVIKEVAPSATPTPAVTSSPTPAPSQ
jgi:hypothetical protein